MNGRTMRRHHLRRQQEEGRALAEDWFGGDSSRADAVLLTLPYSTIPDWTSVRDVLDAIVAHVDRDALTKALDERESR